MIKRSTQDNTTNKNNRGPSECQSTDIEAKLVRHISLLAAREKVHPVQVNRAQGCLGVDTEPAIRIAPERQAGGRFSSSVSDGAPVQTEYHPINHDGQQAGGVSIDTVQSRASPSAANEGWTQRYPHKDKAPTIRDNPSSCGF